MEVKIYLLVALIGAIVAAAHRTGRRDTPKPTT